MLLNGKKLDGPRVVTKVFPRGDNEEDAIVLQAKAVLDYDNFDKLCPPPVAPVKILAGGEKSSDITDAAYLEKVNIWAERKTQWVILESLSATEGLKWQTVDMGNPETWGNYTQELKEAGFTPAERSMLVAAVFEACGMNQDKIDEATKRFLAARRETQSE